MFYAVRNGRKRGVYKTWPECKQQVCKFSGAQFRRFEDQEEAHLFAFGEKKEKASNEGVTRVYTDGACRSNPGGPCAAAALYMNEEGKEISRVQYLGKGTNNIAELEAHLSRMLTHRGVSRDRTIMVSDSQYAINVVQGIWKAKANVDLIHKIREKLKSLQSLGKPVEFEWVKAHHVDPLNNRVDHLATQEIQKFS